MQATADPSTQQGVSRGRVVAVVMVGLVAAVVAAATAPATPEPVATGTVTLSSPAEVDAVVDAIDTGEATIEVQGSRVVVTAEHESPTAAAVVVNRSLGAATEVAADATVVRAAVPEDTDASVWDHPAVRALIAGALAALAVMTVLWVLSTAQVVRSTRRTAATLGGGPARSSDGEGQSRPKTKKAPRPAETIADQLLHRGADATVSSVAVASNRPKDGAAEFATELARTLALRDREVLLVEEDRDGRRLEQLLELPDTETYPMPVDDDHTVTCSAAGLWGPVPQTLVLARMRMAEWTQNDTIVVLHVAPGADSGGEDIWRRSADAVIEVKSGRPVLARTDDRAENGGGPVPQASA